MEKQEGQGQVRCSRSISRTNLEAAIHGLFAGSLQELPSAFLQPVEGLESTPTGGLGGPFDREEVVGKVPLMSMVPFWIEVFIEPVQTAFDGILESSHPLRRAVFVFRSMHPFPDDGKRGDCSGAHRSPWSSIARVVPASIGKLGLEVSVFKSQPQFIGHVNAPLGGVTERQCCELGRRVVDSSSVRVRSIAPPVDRHAETAEQQLDVAFQYGAPFLREPCKQHDPQ